MPIAEVIPGVFHWRTPHPNIGAEVDSFWLEPEGVLIDPLVPAEGVDWFATRQIAPQAIVLCNRHHYRHCDQFVARFDCGPVHVPAAGLHAFSSGQPVVGYKPGDELPGGLEPVEIGVLAPDDGALYLPRAKAIWFADSIVRSPGDTGNRDPLGFVPDGLMDDPEGTKRGILAAVQRILDDHQIEHVFMAHGGCAVGSGEQLLAGMVAGGGHTIHF